MIRHIVLFKTKGSTTAEEKERLIAALKGLKEKISLVKELEVGCDLGNKPNSYHIGLNSTFETFEDVESYAVHPEHVKVVEMIKNFCEPAVKIDYEF